MSPDVLSQQGEPLPTGAHEWYWGNGHPCCVNCGALARCEHQYERNRADTELRTERDALILAANSARVLIERHRARHGSNDLLNTALRELDDVLPTYQEERVDAEQ